jgi:hypothetical protein
MSCFLPQALADTLHIRLLRPCIGIHDNCSLNSGSLCRSEASSPATWVTAEEATQAIVGNVLNSSICWVSVDFGALICTELRQDFFQVCQQMQPFCRYCEIVGGVTESSTLIVHSYECLGHIFGSGIRSAIPS